MYDTHIAYIPIFYSVAMYIDNRKNGTGSDSDPSVKYMVQNIVRSEPVLYTCYLE
jgi:hypothetical protein